MLSAKSCNVGDIPNWPEALKRVLEYLDNLFPGISTPRYA